MLLNRFVLQQEIWLGKKGRPAYFGSVEIPLHAQEHAHIR